MIPDQRPGVAIGSHLDCVPDGGAFDGPLGVVSALAAIDPLRADGFQPRRPIGVVNFVDEEGARFGVSCAGSRVLTGALDPDRARALRDGDGVSMAEAMAGRRAGPGRPRARIRRLWPGSVASSSCTSSRAALAVGPDGEADLDDPARAVGVGTAIWPHGRWRIDIPGEANHAGTTRLRIGWTR